MYQMQTFFSFKLFSKFGQTKYLVQKSCPAAVIPYQNASGSPSDILLPYHIAQNNDRSRKRPSCLMNINSRIRTEVKVVRAKETDTYILKHTITATHI